jgi:hypothetical protein
MICNLTPTADVPVNEPVIPTKMNYQYWLRLYNFRREAGLLCVRGLNRLRTSLTKLEIAQVEHPDVQHFRRNGREHIKDILRIWITKMFYVLVG